MIGTVAVFSDASAPFVGEADVAVRLPGRAPADTYLRGDLVIAAAPRAGADAIHPGSRRVAIRTLVGALRGARIHGGRTDLDFLRAILDVTRMRAAWAAAFAEAAHATATAEVLGGVPTAYRNVDVDGPHGSFDLTPVPRFVDPADVVAEGSLLAPMPASVASVAVTDGQQVAKGDVVVLEAMKMQHTITAPTDGVVTGLSVTAGAQVASGAVLAVIHASTSSTDGEEL